MSNPELIERLRRAHAVDLRDAIEGGYDSDPIFGDAREAIERLTGDVRMLSAQSTLFARRLELADKLLCDILAHLPAQAIKLEDGRVMLFVDPDPIRTLRMIQEALQAAFDRARVQSCPPRPLDQSPR